MKKAVKVIVCLVLALVLIVIGYLAYVLIDYHRIGNEVIDRNPAIAEKAEVNKEYDMVSWNIGFGAYESDYGFFMDGGTESRARSKERLHSNMEKISSLDLDVDSLKEQAKDLYNKLESLDLNINQEQVKGFFDRIVSWCKNIWNSIFG